MDQRSLPPIWVLNLRRSPDRRERITKHLNDLGLPFELIEAIDGKALSKEECDRVSDATQARRFLGRELVPAEIGCSLSHRLLYQKQVEEGHEEVLILEDDVVLAPDFLQVLALREALPADWELVYFHRGDTRISFWGSRPLGRWRSVRFASLAYHTYSYLLRQSGAQKLLARSYPVGLPADWLTGGAVRTGVRLYGIDPPCASEYSREPAASTMPDAVALRPRKPTREEVHPVTWHILRMLWGTYHTYQYLNPFCRI